MTLQQQVKYLEMMVHMKQPMNLILEARCELAEIVDNYTDTHDVDYINARLLLYKVSKQAQKQIRRIK